MSRTAILHPDGRFRCPWPGTDPFYVAYHDEEWGVPEYDGRALFEKLILDGFQAGPVLDHHPAQARAVPRGLRRLRSAKIARYGPEKVEALMADAGIVRNRAKIEGTIEGPRPGSTSRRSGGFSRYLWGSSTAARSRTAGGPWRDPGRDAAVAAPSPRTCKARGFSFVGPTIVYAFMQAVGMVNDHLVDCYRHDECAALGRAGHPG